MVKGQKENMIQQIEMLNDISIDTLKRVLENHNELTDNTKFVLDAFYRSIKSNIEIVLNHYEEQEN